MRKDFSNINAFPYPNITSETNFISNQIKIINNDGYYKVIATESIPRGTIIIKESPLFDLFGEKNIDPAVQIIYKMIVRNYNRNYDVGMVDVNSLINQLHPRTTVNTIINRLRNDINKLPPSKMKSILEFTPDDIITQFYLKYLYNAFSMYKYAAEPFLSLVLC